MQTRKASARDAGGGVPDPATREEVQDRARVRDATVYAYRMSGETLEAIGQRFGFTRERTRQLCQRHAGTVRRMASEVGTYGIEILTGLREAGGPGRGKNPGGGFDKF